MVPGPWTPGGQLQVPDHISDEELLRNPMWVKVDDKLIRNGLLLLEYGKDNHLTEEKMV